MRNPTNCAAPFIGSIVDGFFIESDSRPLVGSHS
jgi:hypothetical protein